jgi:hypothetical protein
MTTMLKVSDCYNRPVITTAPGATSTKSDVEMAYYGYAMGSSRPFQRRMPSSSQITSETEQWQQNLFVKYGLKPMPVSTLVRGGEGEVNNNDYSKVIEPASTAAASQADDDDDYCEIIEVRSYQPKKANKSTSIKRKREKKVSCGLNEPLAKVNKRRKVNVHKKMPTVSLELAMSKLDELDLYDELIPPLLINETEDIDLFGVLQDSVEEQTQLFFNMPDGDLDDFYLGFLEGKSPTQTINAALSGGKCLY